MFSDEWTFSKHQGLETVVHLSQIIHCLQQSTSFRLLPHTAADVSATLIFCFSFNFLPGCLSWSPLPPPPFSSALSRHLPHALILLLLMSNSGALKHKLLLLALLPFSCLATAQFLLLHFIYSFIYFFWKLIRYWAAEQSKAKASQCTWGTC